MEKIPEQVAAIDNDLPQEQILMQASTVPKTPAWAVLILFSLEQI